MIAKRHEIDLRVILAVCDEEHLGKEYEENELCFKVSERFFSGQKISEKELEEIISKVDSVNLFGNKCVGIAIRKGIISEKQVIKIKGIKHAQIYNV